MTCAWLLSRSTMFPRFIHVAAHNSFLSMGKCSSAVETDHILYIHSPTHGQLSGFHHSEVTLLLQQSQVVPPQPRLFFPLTLQDPQRLYRLSSATTITSALFTRHQASKGSDPTYTPHTRPHAQAGVHTPAQARERLIPRRGWMVLVTPSPHPLRNMMSEDAC